MRIKYKHYGRIYGTILAGGVGAMGGYGAFILCPVLTQDEPLAAKVFVGAVLGIEVLIGGLCIGDGLTDVAKGTHHYLGMRIQQKLTKSEERKADIEGEIQRQLAIREETIFVFPKKAF